MSNLGRSSALTREFVLAKCDGFVDMQVWPTNNRVMPRDWLKNFSDTEMDYALSLLNSFFFYSEEMINSLMMSAFVNLSSELLKGSDKETHKLWKDFKSSLYVTHVTGETPNSTDSGHIFARKARQILGIKENRIVTSSELGAIFEQNGEFKINLIIVDDFVGSGTQFTEFMNRTHLDADNINIYFIPLICTQLGAGVINERFPNVTLSPANMLSEKHSAFSENTIIFPRDRVKGGREFIFEASKRAGIIDELGDYWMGFNNLGLTVAFYHGVPDATLPLLHWEKNNWKPLIRRL